MRLLRLLYAKYPGLLVTVNLLDSFRKLYASPVSTAFTFYCFEGYFDVLNGRAYNIQHPPLAGIAQSTTLSDADWVLLVDGPSDPEHAMLAREIEKRVRAIVPKEVGPTGTFGDIVASHELVHYIAGTRDSNENLTRRILLLSES